MNFVYKLNGIHFAVIIILIYLIISIINYNLYEFKIVNDSIRYLNYAEELKYNFYVDPHNIWYFGYVLFIYLSKQISSEPIFIIIFQYILGLIGIISLFYGSLILFNSKRAAVYTIFCYLVFYEIILWQSYVLCEGIYSSFICILLFAIIWYKKQRTKIGLLFLTVVIFFTIFIKPTGITIIISLLIYILYYLFKEKYNNIKLVITSLMFIGISIIILNRMLTTYVIIENYALGEIIYGVSGYKGLHNVEPLLVSVPNNLYIPAENLSALNRIYLFIFYNPIYWSKLFFLKICYYVIHIRPYWSIAHNIFSLLILIPNYILSVIAVKKMSINLNIRILLATYIVMHIIIIGFTSVDWDGRFLMPILPVIFLFAGYAFSKIKLSNITLRI